MLREQPFLIGGDTWLEVWDGNPTAAAIYESALLAQPRQPRQRAALRRYGAREMSSAQYITLSEWAARKFNEPPHVNTLRRWARDGMIVPQPFKVGRDYMVVPNARHRNEPAPGKSLTDRMRNGLAPA